MAVDSKLRAFFCEMTLVNVLNWDDMEMFMDNSIKISLRRSNSVTWAKKVR